MKKNVREIRIEGNVAIVPLTMGYEAIIDACDAGMVDGVKWRVSNVNTKYSSYAVREVRTNSGGRTSLYMHRLIVSASDGLVVDHIDGNGLNNRRSNLRVVSHRENLHNTAPPRNNTSGVKGVSFDRDRGKWFAKITIRGKQIALGRYAEKQDAMDAYDRAFEKYNGWKQYR